MENITTKDFETKYTNLPYDLILLNEKEYCRITNQKLATARANRIKGKGCNFYKIGGSVRYKLSEIVEYVEKCKRCSTSQI
jgi:hypothetical protein